LRAKFKYGAKDYAVGNHPLWELFRTVYQMKQRPFCIGGVALASGYFWSMVRRVKRPVSPELVTFTRREQMQRLSKLLGSKIGARPTAPSLGAQQ
jgi:poly-beta-1,6-N-acetyl-D-glucosamine synthase